jgi:general secretion pathway protein L
MPQRILALELDANELKAAVVDTTFRDYRVAGFFREALGNGHGSAVEQLRHFLQGHQLEGATVLSSLPGDLVSLRTFFLPFRDRKKLDQTVPFELESQVPFGLDEVIVDYQVLQRDKSGCTVLAALVHRQDLEAHLALLREAGVDPKVVDLAPLAALNVLTALGKDLPETCAYVGGNPRRVTVALFRNRQLVGLRTLVPTILAEPTDAEAAAAGNGHPAASETRVAAIVNEVRWTLLALNGAPLDDALTCFVAGDGLEFDAIAQQLRGLDLGVVRLDQSRFDHVAESLRPQVENFAGPLGLALREVAPAEAYGLNFRQGEFAYHRGQDELRRTLFRTGILAVVALAALVISTYMDYVGMARRLDLVEGQIHHVFTQTVPHAKAAKDERAALQAEIDAAQKKLQLLGGIAPLGGATAVDVMRTIATAIPENLKIDVDEYIMDTEGVRIKAKTDSFETADAIKQRLVNTRYFGDVQVKDIKAAADGSVDFRILLGLNKEGTKPAPQP